ncbi:MULTISPECIES: beta-ketoacyl-[acyl-carrier-protein] synthase family protein [Legionella]|uniref:3-oxoacyl-ACP synthase n=1 Tax=Legionella septentrionalis TaxID=2498109 RepID=A0A433JIX8_9GAMM|nr:MULTISPECIES: beta-ketoacyl synthase N-terminal-like domain-containing protein [Legionella]MCP0913844.1 3-oxoacyl-ACP synthase [Legionella sp. 27cVA30]RUQ85285.1 3-oxoacyl-ACP synthase [Legionella septentrionalis]RUQ98691.1 3-oxoacyl-ACP synthase [Legionella septentrionalis]RUR09937.1 3-oxoacyl-ACP synthase [Legionella septentrionalis]RUR14984.1 3-oxoacyl-ACP synthase [Legionella septentrionalis]
MNNTRRVFITGLGALTASGATLEQTWNAILTGKQGIGDIKQWDLSSWTHRIGGELQNFQPAKMLPDRKLIKVISRQDVIGLNAAIQAVEHSGLLTYRDSLEDAEQFNDETGIYVGSPGNKYCQQYDFLSLVSKSGKDMQKFASQLFGEVHPMWLLRILPNNVLAYTGITYGFKGPNHNITNHAVGGMQAILEAYHAIKSGQAERAVVVAYDLGTEPQGLFYYEKLGLLSARHLKPFDSDHDGTLLSEGAAALVLESEQSARARSASCYAEIMGGKGATEASGLFALEAEGKHLAAMMEAALAEQEIRKEEVGLLIAHGNGNKQSDVSEAHALQNVFADYHIPLTSFKWSMGHTLSAAGVLDTALATYALHTQCIPGIANFASPAKGCEGLNICKEHRTLAPTKPYAVVVNRGFASINTCLVIKACV